MPVNQLTVEKGTYLGLHSGQGRAGAGDAIAAGATNNYDFDVSDFDNVTICVSQTGAAATDLVIGAQPFDTTDTVHPANLSPSAAPQTNIVSGANVLGVVQYDVRGLRKLRVTVKNANAGAKVVNFVDIFASVTGVDF